MFTDYAEATRVDEEYRPVYTTRIQKPNGDGDVVEWTQTVSEVRYRLVGLTRTAAETGADALNATVPLGSVQAKAQRSRGAMWSIVVSGREVGEWSEGEVVTE